MFSDRNVQAQIGGLNVAKTINVMPQVASLQMLYLGEVGAEELLRPYRGVVSYHADAVRHLKSGPCVALKIQVSK